jgi:hypothetical protein
MRAALPATVVITSPFLARDLLSQVVAQGALAPFASGPGALALLVILRSGATKNLSGLVGRGFNRDIKVTKN